MGDTWITDMTHYLDDTGRLGTMPGPALNIALFLGSIVAWVSTHASGDCGRTNVVCRRTPGRRRCVGEIVATLAPESARIMWRCPVCGDNGLIHGWEGTRWDRRLMVLAE